MHEIGGEIQLSCDQCAAAFLPLTSEKVKTDLVYQENRGICSKEKVLIICFSSNYEILKHRSQQRFFAVFVFLTIPVTLGKLLK